MISEVSCPACGASVLKPGPQFTFQTQGGRLSSRILSCPACTHVFLHTDEQTHALTETDYAHDYVGFRVDPVFAERARKALEEELKPLCPQGRLLDVGCGNGEFMRIARDAGYSVRGVDISEAAVAQCREAGLDAAVGDFPNMAFDEQFDCVTMWDVIEHLRDPVAFISKARSLLKPGGVLLLKIPGFEGAVVPVVGAVPRLARSMLHAPHHVQYFTRASCERAIRRAGFEQMAWFPNRSFRSRPPTRSLKRHVSRAVSGAVARACGATNLFVACVS
jgi:2-polyprenyl-3-methyl-5-hydroxy-6-metoxy-1,4-benzoquinol methylase